MELFTVIGATGNIGSKISQQLLQQGKKLRAVARDLKKCEPLRRAGAEVVSADILDTPALTQTLKGATAAFVMIPPNYGAADMRGYLNKASESIAAAIKNSGIQYIVNLSSIGAHEEKNLGPINNLHFHEKRLNALTGAHLLHVRPAYFMENLLWNIDLIKNMKINGSPLKADLPMAMIATHDIATFITQQLITRNFRDKSVRELLGQRDLTFQEITTLLGQAVGQPQLPYIQFPYADAEKAMLQMGMSADAAAAMIEMQKGFNDGFGKPTETRSQDNTTSTSIETFIKQTFIPAYR